MHAAILGAAQVPCRHSGQRSAAQVHNAHGACRKTAEIAATAARMVVEEGLEYGAGQAPGGASSWACRRARPAGQRRGGGCGARVHRAVLRRHPAARTAGAARAGPDLDGAAGASFGRTWAARSGTARPRACRDIYIQLFCDDPKSAEIALIDQGVDYEPRTVTGFTGEPVEALSLQPAAADLGETVGRAPDGVRPRRPARRPAARCARPHAAWRFGCGARLLADMSPLEEIL